MENIDKDTIKLIEELCQKEVERIGLPLVLNEDDMLVQNGILYFHQKMTLDLEGFNETVLVNQNHLAFKDGKWRADSFDSKFYGYELYIRQGVHSFMTSIRLNSNLSKENLTKKLSSDKFKEMFDKYKELDKEMHEMRDNLKFFINR